MRKVLFITDFWKQQHAGGAENNDYNLLSYLSNYCDLSGANTYDMTREAVDNADFIIVSNFIHLPADIKGYIEDSKPYIIYEHDHKYVQTRDPSIYVDFIVPPELRTNESFYINAQKVFVLSSICKEVLEKNIPEAKVYSIGCSLWSDETFDYIEELLNEEKKNDLCILKSGNPIKNTSQSLAYCEKNDIVPFELSDPDYKTFLKKMASCKRFLFIPGVLETFSRISAEAKMLNLKLLTTPKKLGFASEKDLFCLSGTELISALRGRNKLALGKFREELGL